MKRNLRKAFAFILALTMVVSLFACGKKDANPDGGDSSSDDTFTIAYIGPLTGEASAWGTPEANTLKLLVDQVNAEGGIAGKKVILNTYDNRGDNVETTNAAKKAIEVGGADVIVGCNSSGASLALASVCEEYKVPSVATCATNSKVTEDDNGNVREWTFRVCLADPALGNVMAKYPTMFTMAKSNELTMTVILGGTGSLTGTILAGLVLIPLPEYLRIESAEEWRMVLYGVLVVAVIVFKPSGLMGSKEFTVAGVLRRCKQLAARVRKRGSKRDKEGEAKK